MTISFSLRRLSYALVGVFLLTLASTHLYAQSLGTTTFIQEGTCPVSGTSGYDLLCGNSSDHAVSFSFNAGGVENIPQTFYTSSTFTNSNSAFATVTGLTFPISASRNYHAICTVIWKASTSTAGPKYQITGPSGASAINLALLSPVTINTFTSGNATTYSSAVANTGTLDNSQTFTDRIDIAVMNGSTAGTVSLQAQANGTGTLTINPASACQVQ